MATLLTILFAAYVVVVRAGYLPSQAAVQTALFAVDGLIVLYVAFLVTAARRATESAASRSEARLRDLIELAPEAFFLADLDARFVDVNRAACRMLGYEREELVGKTIFDIIPPEDVPRLMASKEALLVPGSVEISEWTHRKKDGTLIPVELSANILSDGRWQAFSRDISRRRRAEEALRSSEARFSGIISISADAIISIDRDQRINLFNEGAERIFGYTSAEAIGAHLDLLLPEGVPATEGRTGEHLAKLTGRRKNGEDFPAEAAISTLTIGGETVLTVDLRDVTDQRRTEREQRFLAAAGEVLSSSLDYEKTLASLGDLVVRDLADWCIVDIVEEGGRTKRVKVVSADPRQAALAARFEQLPLERSQPHLVRAVLETGRPFLIERMAPEELASFAQGAEHLEILRAIGPRSLLAVPLIAHGQLLGLLGLIASTSSRVFGPRDLGLAQALADRAALAIENGRLYQKAVRATRLRDEVLGVVAHDLRNPVAAILLQVAALQRRAPETEGRAQKSRETISRAATHMNRLINDLLDVSLIEAGQLGIERSRISTSQLLADSVEGQRPLAASASLELQLDLASELPDVWADHMRLLQVLANLVGNAIKFTSGGGRITVGAASREGEVLFWVADTGCGITPEGLPHVFDHFWQASKGGGKGAGLGLPITRGIVETHGGRIWVESTPGRGSIFFFTIPQAPAAQPHVAT